jgi:hydrogenase nickel incorporation protein HypA/HybF
MHELTLIKNVLDIVLQVSRDNGGRKVEGVHLKIGTLRQVVPEFLQFAFEAVVTGTEAEGATLTWSLVPLRVHCHQCEEEFDAEQLDWRCTYCGATGGQIVRGDELIVDTVELAEEAEEGMNA